MKRILMSVIGLVVFLAVLTVIVHKYHQTSLPKPVVLQGQLEAKETNVATEVSGRIGHILVAEGDSIDVGTLIMRMDTPEIDAKIAQAEAVRDAANALAQKAEAGARKQEIQMANEQMQRAKAGLDVAEKTWRRVSSLSKEGLLSRQKADEVNAKYISARKQYQTAQARYSMVKEGARKEDIVAAKAKARQGQAVVDEVMVAEKEANLRSPVVGEVAEVIPSDGEVIAKGVPIITVVNLNEQRLELNVREDYLKHFAIGSRFIGEIPALDEKSVEFNVYASAVLPDFATWRPTRTDQGFDMRTFLVKSRPTNVIKGMRPGMSVLVTLPTDSAQ